MSLMTNEILIVCDKYNGIFFMSKDKTCTICVLHISMVKVNSSIKEEVFLYSFIQVAKGKILEHKK